MSQHARTNYCYTPLRTLQNVTVNTTLKQRCVSYVFLCICDPGIEQPGLNEWAAPTLSAAGYSARPAPAPLQSHASSAEAAIQSCLLSLSAPSGAVYACGSLSEMVARLEARGVNVCPPPPPLLACLLPAYLLVLTP